MNRRRGLLALASAGVMIASLATGEDDLRQAKKEWVARLLDTDDAASFSALTARSPAPVAVLSRERVEESGEHVEVVLGGRVIASTTRSWRVLETSHPPSYYIPPGDIAPGVLRPAAARDVVLQANGRRRWRLRDAANAAAT